MRKISIENIPSKKKLFHNEWIDVYEKELHFDEIDYWVTNDRTLFTFERLEKQLNKKLVDISLEEITNFVISEPIHKMGALIKSIERNGVQVPLIVSESGKLLDGNRRYFACSAIKFRAEEKKQSIPEVLIKIPTLIIKDDDLKINNNELRIIAEANFLPDLKVTWPIDAQARAIRSYLQTIEVDKRHQALNDIKNVLGITKSDAVVLLESLDLADEFVNQAKNDQELLKRKKIIEDKFVFFWEFRNKGIKGKNGLKNLEELSEVKEVFFNFMNRGNLNPIKNVKLVEPLILARRDMAIWKILKDSDGNDFAHVVNLVNEQKEGRLAEDKIRLFTTWLNGTTDLTQQAKSNLKKLADLALKKAS